uniref:Uncharacterized protein n=1 Tax=Heterorhabditis bacteriophora TaxID=37862 RepID=A0A1I7WD30_HETBA
MMRASSEVSLLHRNRNSQANNCDKFVGFKKWRLTANNRRHRNGAAIRENLRNTKRMLPCFRGSSHRINNDAIPRS